MRRSEKITNIQTICCVLIVFIHANTAFINLPGQPLQMIYGNNISTYIQLFFAEGICRSAVPMFFVISGYLFYRSFDGTFSSYLGKMRRRVFSLVIPYLFWSSIVFAAFTVAQKIPNLAGYFTMRNGPISVTYVIYNVFFESYNYPLWFIRYLIVFSVLSYFIYPILVQFPLESAAFFFWFYPEFHFGFRMDAAFFYLLGSTFAVRPNFYHTIKRFVMRRRLYIASTVLWLLVLMVRTALLCSLDPSALLDGKMPLHMTVLENTGIMLGVPTIWFLYDRVSPNVKKLHTHSGDSFLIFTLHHPVVNCMKKILMRLMGVSEFTSLLTYFAASFITIVVILALSRLGRSRFPVIYRFVCGGR